MIGGKVLCAYCIRNCIRRRNFHVLGDLRCATIERATENTGECKDVIDLVREIASARCHNGDTAFGFFRTNLGIGVRHGKHDRILGHRQNVLTINEIGATHANEYIGARHDVSQ
ncbi:unannotated protein [freshwater metagenome]|uniref:Unannotated protein n=1 Tax=freshwater metagenome TaxID=449393 RepID=A0A6J7MAQ4_9ZZZZ